MHIVKSFLIACSTYSKIPVPQFPWKEEDMKYTLCFFPWIGGIIGLCVYLWSHVSSLLGIGQLCYTAVAAAIPILFTGGFHVDGFMDTMDAFCSYQPKERKLEILKDSHIGAFAVIMLGAYGLLYLGAFSEIKEDSLLKILCSGFFLSRSLSGISVVSFPLAKKKGSLSFLAGSSQKNMVRICLFLQAIACVMVMCLWSFTGGILVALGALLSFGYYYWRCKRELGGITGDTAGYFVLISELSMVLMAAFLNVAAR